MQKRSVIRHNWPKYLLQFASLGAIIALICGVAGKWIPSAGTSGAESYFPLGGFEAFVNYVCKGYLPDSMTAFQLMVSLAFAAGTIIFSNLFCSFICPTGAIEDIISRIRDSIGMKSLVIPYGSITDKALRLIKYIIIFWIFCSTAELSAFVCRSLDPFYVFASGFKGSTIIAVAAITIFTVFILAIAIDRFWCRYVCPMGAILNSLKFWIQILAILAFWDILLLLGFGVSWRWMLACTCLMAYLLEILDGKPKLQILHIMKNDRFCNMCDACEKQCPYNIPINSFDGKVTAIDCTLCGDCVASCKRGALHVGFSRSAGNSGIKVLIAPALAVSLLVAGGYMGRNVEIPAVNETWRITGYDADSSIVQLVNPDMLVNCCLEGLESINGRAKAMALKTDVERIPGTYGIKIFTGSGKVIIRYNPEETTEERIRSQVFEPSRFQVTTPDPEEITSVSVRTIFLDNFFDKNDLKRLGAAMEQSGKRIFGLESEYGKNIKVRVFHDPSEDLDADWFDAVIQAMPAKTGCSATLLSGIEEKSDTLGIDSYLHQMFKSYKEAYNGTYTDSEGNSITQKRAVRYEKKSQWIFELSGPDFGKPSVRRSMPYFSRQIRDEEGLIELVLGLNKDLQPALMLRYAYPLSSSIIREKLADESWKDAYDGDIRKDLDDLVLTGADKVYPYGK